MRRIMRRIISFLLMMVMLCTVILVAFAEDTAVTTATVTPSEEMGFALDLSSEDSDTQIDHSREDNSVPEAATESSDKETARDDKEDLSDTGASHASGTLNGMNWTLSEGVLTIEGQGAMSSFGTKSSRPWHDYRNEITKVVICDGITEITDYAFCDFYYLNKIVMPDSLVTIGANAFDGGRCLSELAIPDSVEIIEKNAFRSCDHTNAVYLGAGVRYIGSSAFQMEVSQFEVSPENKYYHSIDGVLYDRDDVLTVFPQKMARTVPDFIVPEGTKGIGDGAFMSNTYLNSVTLPDSVVSIGKSAFEFSYLKSIDLGKGLAEIGERAFSECRISHFELPASLKAIGHSAFERTGLSGALVNIPKNVESIGERAFYSSFASIDVASDNKYYTSVDGVLYNKNKTELFYYPMNSAMTSFVCPSTLEVIHDYAFDIYYGYKAGPKTVTLNEGLRIIGSHNFSAGYLEGRLVIPDTVTEIGEQSFRNSDLTEIIIGKRVVKMDFSVGIRASGRILFKGEPPSMYYAQFGQNIEIFTPVDSTGWSRDVFEKNKIDVSTASFYTWDSTVFYPVHVNNLQISLEKSTYTYDGVVKRPEITVKHNNKKLISGFDYQVYYSDNKDAGQACVTVEGRRNYYGSTKLYFSISQASQKVTVSLTRTEIEIGKTAYAAASGYGKITFRSSDPSVAAVNANGLVTAKKAGTATIYVTAAGNKNYRSAEGSTTIKVKAAEPRYDIGTLSYSFSNSAASFGYKTGYRIPIERYRMFYTGTEIDYMYDLFGVWKGNCHGMTTTALLFNTPYSGLDLTSFRSTAHNVSDLRIGDKNTSYNLTVKELIEGMLISQMTNESNTEKARHWDDLNGFVKEVKKCNSSGSPVVFNYGIEDNGGHSLLAYRVDKLSSTKSRVAVYDCNSPMTERYIQLTTDSSGKPLSWEYTLSGLPVGTEYRYKNKKNNMILNCYMTYLTVNTVKEVWNSRLTNKSRAVSRIAINSDNFIMKNSAGTKVAEMTDGVLKCYANNVFGYELADVECDSHVLNVPTGMYTLTAEDVDIDHLLEVSMLNMEQQVTVKTESDTVSVIVADEAENSNVMIDGEKGEAYEVTINSELECAENAEKISYHGKSEGKVVSLGTVNGEVVTNAYTHSFAYINDDPYVTQPDGSKDIDMYCSVKLDNTSFAYTGDSVCPEVTVTDYFDDKTCSEGEDYILVYSNNIVRGKATVMIQGIGEYHGSVVRTFDIGAIDINKCDAYIIQEDLFYEGEAVEPDIAVFYENQMLKEGLDYVLTFSDNNKAGTASVKIQAKSGGNFSGSFILNFTIKKGSIPASGVTVTPSDVTLLLGDKLTLNAVVEPSDATDQTIQWSSGTPSVATVNSKGEVTGVSVGTAVVTAQTSNGLTASCTVNVVESLPEFEYRLLDDGSAEITKYNGSGANVIIPNRIDGYKVTSVGRMLFYRNQFIESVALPSSLTNIGDYCFTQCPKLTKVNIPDSVENIGKYAFYENMYVDYMHLPSKLKYVGEAAFCYCKRAEEPVVIPDTVVSIGKFAFLDSIYKYGVKVPQTTTTIDQYAFGYYRANDTTYIDHSFEVMGKEGSTAQTFANEYRFTFVSTDDLPTTVSGDTDGDRVVSLIDVTLIQRFCAGIPVAVKISRLMNGDVDRNDVLDVADATFIQRYCADFSVPYPIGG